MMEEMGIIQNVGIGCRDRSTPMLWFTVKAMRHSSLQCLNWQEAFDLLKEHCLSSVDDLEKMPCVIKTSGNQSIFLRILK